MMELAEALATLRDTRGAGDVVITTMSAAKVWMEQNPQPHPLDLVFVPSSMGHASSMGLGLALAQPTRRVIVANGDGSLLMNLGGLVTIAAAEPANLVLLVLDNGVYEVTGGQPVPRQPDYAALARASGITQVFHLDSAEQWKRECADILRMPGPTVVVLEVRAVPDRGAPRSPGVASERARALRAALTRGPRA